MIMHKMVKLKWNIKKCFKCYWFQNTLFFSSKLCCIVLCYHRKADIFISSRIPERTMNPHAHLRHSLELFLSRTASSICAMIAGPLGNCNYLPNGDLEILFQMLSISNQNAFLCFQFYLLPLSWQRTLLHLNRGSASTITHHLTQHCDLWVRWLEQWIISHPLSITEHLINQFYS